MNKQTFKLAVLAAASFGWISLAAAQGPGPGHEGHMRHGGPGGGPGFEHGPGGPGGPGMGMLIRRLDLSEEQQAQLKAIHEKERTAAEPLLKAAGEAREAFEKALEGDNPNPAAVGQAALNMRNAKRAVEAHHKATFEQVKSILNPEQLARLEEMEKRGPRRGPGGPHGQGPGRRGPRDSK